MPNLHVSNLGFCPGEPLGAYYAHFGGFIVAPSSVATTESGNHLWLRTRVRIDLAVEKNGELTLEEHNIKEQPRPSNGRHTLGQEHLSAFFAERDEPSGATLGDFRSLISALENFQDSPVSRQLAEQLLREAEAFQNGSGPGQHNGVSQTFLDSLDRVPKKKLAESDSCAICSTPYLDDKYPLVVRLPCDPRHHFDLECVGPWLKLHATCPLCRKNLLEKKQIPVEEDSEEEFDDTYA